MKRMILTRSAVLLLAAGCMSSPKNAKTEMAKPAAKVPPAVSRVLPAEQLNDANAREQAELLSQTLSKEGSMYDTARRDSKDNVER